MNTDLHFSSATDQWATPQDFFDRLNREFKFTLDVCAGLDNFKCPAYYDNEDNGLVQPWEGACWMNPPYGREIGKWVKKAFDSARENLATVVCLLPARTDTKWFHEYCIKGEIRLVKGRLKFGGSETGAPFPSMVVIFRPDSLTPGLVKAMNAKEPCKP